MSRRRTGAKLAVVLILASGCMASPGSSSPLESRAQQDGVEMVVTVDRSAARIADPVTVTVEVHADESQSISPPELVAGDNDFVAVEIGDMEFEVTNGRQTLRRAFTFESYAAGRIVVPTFSAKYAAAGESPSAPHGHALRSQPLSVRVLSSAGIFADPREFRDNISVVDPPHGWLFWTFVGLLAIVGIVALITILLSQARRLAKPRTAGEIALRDLKSIEHRGVREQWNANRTIAAADAVLRTFLQQFWRLPDSQLTAQELAWATEAQCELRDDERAEIQRLLRLADQRKFAPSDVSPVEADRALVAIRELIIAMTQPKTLASPGALQEATVHV